MREGCTGQRSGCKTKSEEGFEGEGDPLSAEWRASGKSHGVTFRSCGRGDNLPLLLLMNSFERRWWERAVAHGFRRSASLDDDLAYHAVVSV